jgi:hypothetical protein
VLGEDEMSVIGNPQANGSHQKKERYDAYKKFRMDGVGAGSFDDGWSSNKRAFQRWKELVDG